MTPSTLAKYCFQSFLGSAGFGGGLALVLAVLVGLILAGLVAALFAALIARGYRIARLASDRFSSALAAGLTSLIAVQTILNLCVVTNLLPSTGIALPFFSYGGTALAVNLGEMGIVLSISRQKDSGLVSRRLSSGGKQN